MTDKQNSTQSKPPTDGTSLEGEHWPPPPAIPDSTPPRNLPGALQPWIPGELRWNTYRYVTHTGDANGEVYRHDIKVLEQKWTRAGVSEWHEVPTERQVKVVTP